MRAGRGRCRENRPGAPAMCRSGDRPSMRTGSLAAPGAVTGPEPRAEEMSTPHGDAPPRTLGG